MKRRSKERKAEKAADKIRRREEQQQKDKLKIPKSCPSPAVTGLNKAQQAVNAFIRERDRDPPCISCGTFTSAQWDAGHYRTTAAAPQPDLMSANIHKQCVVCNPAQKWNLVPLSRRCLSNVSGRGLRKSNQTISAIALDCRRAQSD